MRFTEALYYTLKIRKKHPQFKLCGSVALILSGKLPVRDVYDIDFVVNESEINLETVKKSTIYEPLINEKDGYECYSIRDDSTYCYNLFVFKKDIPVKSREINIKIPIQLEDDILKWKAKYNRPKDKEDLRNINRRIKDRKRGILN